MSIGIVSYGVGNIASLMNLISNELGLSAHLIECKSDIAQASHIILPGVGAFDTAVLSMKEKELIPHIKKAASYKPIIGICLGMQLFFDSSEEGSEAGLSLLKGVVKRIPNQSVVLPHVGWSSLNKKKAENALGIDGEEFYFTHSFYVDCEEEYIDYYVDYDVEIPAVIREGNLIGFQFHPEKSAGVGRELFKSILMA